jgi:hypothetical protein
MTEVVGQLTLDGTDAQIDALGPFATRIEAVVGKRIQPVTVRIRARTNMPRYRDPKPGDKPEDGHARGYWKSPNRTILLADDLFALGEPLDETLGHEVVHVLFDDWIKGAPKKALLRYLQPLPENYTDTTIAERDKGYPANPEECLAVYGSAALFGFNPPAYTTLFKRLVPKTSLAEVKALMLGALPVEPPVPAPDPCAEAVAVVTGQLNDERAAHEVTKGEKAELERRIEAKDQKMQEAIAI